MLAAATDHGAFAVAIAGDGDDQIVICYNTSAPDGMSSDDEPPKTTAEALNPFPPKLLYTGLAATVHDGRLRALGPTCSHGLRRL